MPKRKPLSRDLGQVFGVRQARKAGVSRGRLRASDLRVTFRGARSLERIPPVPDRETTAEYFARQRADLIRTCREYAPVAPPDYRFCGITAARLYGIPLPARLARIDTIEVAVASGAQRPRRSGVVGRRLARLPAIVTRSGLPVLPPEVVWFQLAMVLSVDELVVAGDFLVKRKRPDSSLERMTAQVAISRGAHGAKRATEALRDIRSGTDSPKETELRLLLVRAGLPEPVVGYRVIDADGYFIGVPDLAYVDERMALDFEREIHRLDEQVFLDDIERRERFEDADWRYVRVAKNHLKQPGTLLDRVARYLRLRAPRA